MSAAGKGDADRTSDFSKYYKRRATIDFRKTCKCGNKIDDRDKDSCKHCLPKG